VRALVTGGAGFIGSALVDRLLAEGHHVDVVDDLSTGSLANLAAARALGGPLSFHQMDVRVPELVELIVHRRPEVVFHLAAQPDVALSVEKPIYDADINIVGSLRVLEAALAARARKVVFAASGATIYGEGEDGELPFSEQSPQRPTTPYGVAKRVVVDYLGVYRQLYGLEFTALALANVYGPRQSADNEGGLVTRFVTELAAGRVPVIYGDAEQTRDFVYVDDAVDAFARAAERGSGLLINVGTGIETSVADLYRLVARRLGSTVRPKRGPARPAEIHRSALDPARAQIHLGWAPWTTLEAGVAELIAGLGETHIAALR
jgi:UDP-glucose 4-epimerase